MPKLSVGDCVRVGHGEQITGVAQGHLVLVRDGLGEVELAVDVGGAHREGGVEAVEGTRDLVPIGREAAALVDLRLWLR